MKRKNLSFRGKLLVLFLFVGILPLWGIFLYYYTQMKQIMTKKQLDLLNGNYNRMKSQITELFNRAEEVSSFLTMDDVMTGSFYPGNTKKTLAEQIEMFGKVTDRTQKITDAFQVDSICYYIDDAFGVAGENGMYRAFSFGKKFFWMQSVLENGGKSIWSIREDKTPTAEENCLTLCRAVWDKEDYQAIAAILAININKKHMQDLLSELNEDHLIWVKDLNSSKCIYNSDSLAETFSQIPCQETKSEMECIALQGRMYYYRQNIIPDSHIMLGSLLPEEFMGRESKAMRFQMLGMFLAVSIFLVVLIFAVTHSLTEKIFLLTDHMDSVQHGQLELIQKDGGQDEAGRMIDSYNYMVKQIRQLLEEQYRIGQEKKEMELKMLQSQINPHFLYNTLDMITWMAVRNEWENIQNAVRNLSRYYRLVLNRGNDTATVRQEMEMCQAYVNIQAFRFQDRIAYTTEIDPTLMELKMPKIVFQPLVENAILHGISRRAQEGGTIHITGERKGGYAVFQILDDGMGYEGHADDTLGEPSGSGYGIHSIEMRLNLYFDQKESISIESSPGIGTCVTIRIPYFMNHLDGHNGMPGGEED